jgi:serine/threonine protein kinase
VSPETNDALRGSGVLSEGVRLGKYEIVRQLGAGGMGAVYEAVHTQIGKRVAIKVLAPAVAARPEARTRFLREAQLTSKVRHPHAVDVTDMGTEGDQTFLVMELLDGEDLSARLQNDRWLAIADLVDIMLPVCSAVAAAHAAGVIHRDLKPQNIFLARSANGLVPKVLDFGISKVQDTAAAEALTGSNAIIGTPYYLAPEQVLDSRAASPASDQYAIGVVLYECMTGERPFQSDNLYAVFQAIVAGAAARPRDRRPDIDAQFEEVVLRAMNVSPEWRFASVTALGCALWPFASERGRMLWRDTFGSSPSRPQAARPAASSNETADDVAVRTPRWPAQELPGARTPGMTPGATCPRRLPYPRSRPPRPSPQARPRRLPQPRRLPRGRPLRPRPRQPTPTSGPRRAGRSPRPRRALRRRVAPRPPAAQTTRRSSSRRGVVRLVA